MKVFIIILVFVTLVNTITVPPSWSNSNRRYPINQRQHRPNRNTPYHKPQLIRTTPRTQTSQSDWIPLSQPLFINKHQPYIQESTSSRPKTHANKNIPFSTITGSRIHLAPKYYSGPEHRIVDSPQHHISEEDDPVRTNFRTPYSEHELPKDIPTRPIYPGEGQWAKPNRKHKPHVTTYKYVTPTQREEERPEGYDIFERGQERFDVARNKYKTPTKINKSVQESQEDEQQDEFIPEKLYAQVRKTETKKYLPRSNIDSDEDNPDRLREVIKDSKIQTIYTEEGYEDSAYDHAGKEKKAESEEGRIQRAEASENSRRKTQDHQQDQFSEKRGQNRGHTKHRQLKNNNAFTKTQNYDNTELYENAKQKVEKVLADSDISETKSQPVKLLNDNKPDLHTKQQKIEIKSTMKNGDDINMEIHTEVKFINGSDKRKHKFVKIVPSYQRVVEPEEDSSEYESNSNEEIHKRIKRYDKDRLSKTYIRKRPNYYWKRKKTESIRNTKNKSRKKRYTIDYPNIDVPTIKFSNFHKSETQKSNGPKKYPYLKLNTKIVNENSPLRYAENLDYIPKKHEDDMAFYKSRSTKCPEVPDDIDPIPDRIKNMKSTDDVKNGENLEENVGPRLEGLGDKIDCLKVKYFGKEPLDSPIFKEDVIPFVVPQVFDKLKSISKLNLEKKDTPEEQNVDAVVTKKSIKRDIKTFNPIIVQDEELNTTNNPINKQSDAVLKQPFTLQEYTDKMLKNKSQPKSIYDQINLLAVNDRIKTTTENSDFIILYENQSAEPVSNNDDIIEDKIKNVNITNEGNFDPQLSDLVSDLGKYSKELPSNEIVNLLPENFSEYDLLFPITNSSNYIEPTKEEDNSSNNEQEESNLPTHAALRNYRYFSQPPSKFKPSFQDEPKFSSIIFDISKYLPQIKNHKSVTSEVLYKEEIKPSEQLNVYSDVLRSINISTQEAENVQPITVKLQINNNTRTRNPNRKIRIKTTTANPIVDLLTKSEDSTPGTSNNIINMDKTSPQIFPTESPNNPKTLPNKIRTMINQYSNKLIINIPETSQETEIPGLAPPPSTEFRYRTIPPSFSTKIILKPLIRQPKQSVNLFYVSGMRPPSIKQAVMNYNDYNNIKRSKRHLSEEQEEEMFTAESNYDETKVRKPIMYTEIIRQRNPIPEDTEDEDEDLLPKKRTYDFKPRTTTEQTIEYEEIEEPAVENPTRNQPVERPTGLPEYIKIIDKLHDYRFVNNITTTLPEQETTTANPRTTTKTTVTTSKTQTTAESINMGVPAFLQIISALHDTRKQFKPEDSTEETEEELPQEPVQNSNPYIPSALTSLHEETEKDSDPQSHIRNLSNKFRTTIDTSKYKTIERAPIVLRHNLSSRYNADDEILPLEKIFTTKMPAVYTTTIRNEEKELILQRENTPHEIEDEEDSEEVTTTTKATRRRTRPRQRPTTTTTKPTESTTRVVVRRRRPSRPTTEIPTTLSSARRRLRQRLEPQNSIKTYVSEIPPNHKREYVPVTEIARNGELKDPYKTQNDINKNNWKKLYDRIRLQQTTESVEQMEEETNEKKEEVEIIEEIKNPNMKHGGNYRHIDDIVHDLTNKPSSPRNRFVLRRRPNNKSTETTTTERMTTNVYEDFDDEEMIDQEESPVVHMPKIIKDPSKRKYFYAKL